MGPYYDVPHDTRLARGRWGLCTPWNLKAIPVGASMPSVDSIMPGRFEGRGQTREYHVCPLVRHTAAELHRMAGGRQHGKATTNRTTGYAMPTAWRLLWKQYRQGVNVQYGYCIC